MRLGFIYTVTSGGYDDEKVRIGDDSWSSAVEDERQLWLKYSVNGESIAMTIVKDGIVMAITHIIGGGRADDNITTWVYIPSKIRISGVQLQQVLQSVREINKMSTKKVSSESFTNNEILNADYPEKRHPITHKKSYGDEIAVRYPTTDYSLPEILGMPYQEYYTKYKYIFLLSHENDVKGGLENLPDLSRMDIQESICILPLSPESTKRIFGSTKVKVKHPNGMVFDAPVLAKKGQIIDLIAEKPGCIDLPIKGQAVKDEEEIEISKFSNHWERVIAPQHFRIIDSKSNNSIHSALEIEILEPEFNKKNNSLPENRMNQVRVRVSVKGYESFEGPVNLTQVPVTISLTKVVEKETYKCENSYGEKLRVTISGSGAKSKHPLRGYTTKGGELIYDPEKVESVVYHPAEPFDHKRAFAWKEFLYGIIVSIAVLLLCWGGIKLYNGIVMPYFTSTSSSEGQVTNEGKTSTSEQNETDKPQSLSKAIAYLDNNKEWSRDSLIKYPELEGLFEELNSYDFDKILKRKTSLYSSRQFMELFDKIEVNKYKEFNSNFCSEGDYQITVQKYMDKLDKPIEDRPTAPSIENQGTLSKAAKKANSTPPSSSSGLTDKSVPAKGGKDKSAADKGKSKSHGSVM